MRRLGTILTMRLWGRNRDPLTGDDDIWARLEGERLFTWMLPSMMGQLLMSALLPLRVFLDPPRLATRPPGGLLPGDLAALGLLAPLAAVGLACWFGFPRLQQLLDRHLPTRSKRRCYYTADEQRRWKRIALRAGLGLAIALLLLMAVTGNFRELRFFGIVGGAYIAGVIAFYGLRGRRGRDPSCARCGYPAGPEPSQWTTCPECGADLSKPMAVILGRDVRRPHLVVVGAVGYAAATAGFILL